MACTGQDVDARSCPACGSSLTRHLVVSRATHRVVAGCTACGCHWLANPTEAAESAYEQSYDRAVYESYVNAKRSHILDRDYRSTLVNIGTRIRSGGRDLFDVGAGAGEFLALARESGFTPHGNELAPGAIDMARNLAGIDLHRGDLETIGGSGDYDAVTMWCVLAHVADPDELLRNAWRILKPGGVLFLQTPRWSALDGVAIAGARASRGRLTRILDRRVNDHHRVLNSVRGLAAQVQRVGFDVVEVVPRVRFSLVTTVYLQQLGMSPRLSTAAAGMIDGVVDRGWMPRNVLDLYARKPS